MSLSARARNRLWSLATVAGVGVALYSTAALIDVYGFWGGIALAAAMGVAGYLSVDMLYPLWFSNGRKDDGERE